MSAVNEPVRFGDVVKLQTKSAFVESSTATALGFLELPGKTQTQVLVVPPVKEEVSERFVEAEFIIAPIRGEKQQTDGTPLTFQTPFVLRTSDGKDGSTYTLNNKVQGQRDAISLQLAASKGEMYMQVEKEGCTNATNLHFGDDGLSVRVVDSNRIRKTLNHLLTHVAKPKSDTPGGVVTCGAKGTALTFVLQRAVDADGTPKTETRKYIKNPVARRSSLDSLSPSKVDQLSRADRLDSSEFSDIGSRSSSVAGLSSNPASPRAASSTAAQVDASAVAARLATKDAGSNSSIEPTKSNSAKSTLKTPVTPPKNAVAGEKPSKPSPTATPATPPKNAVVEVKTTSPVPSPVKTASLKSKSEKAEPAKTASKDELGKQSTPDVKSQPVTNAAVPPVTPAMAPPATSSAPAPPATITAATNTAPKEIPIEPIVVPANASTFPPSPTINGPAPAPVVISPKTASPKPNSYVPMTPTTPVTKKLDDSEVAQLKNEAEVENLEPACSAKCSLM
ncbi:hypothetical protein PHYBOEH_010202 [Phytophthora boehmeriae]|uniref:Uncharacterized protein n=1 Tax=Phytophthora boehmeriae TaxID=109152 RepID=A0A8T1X376_9STRA|nr:hypothetical protein PHYBOEH_010202 [Phytophthora boehmeriae]